MAEQAPLKRTVAGSIPAGSTTSSYTNIRVGIRVRPNCKDSMSSVTLPGGNFLKKSAPFMLVTGLVGLVASSSLRWRGVMLVSIA